MSDAFPKDPRKNRVIVLEDLNFVWDEEELFDMKCKWDEGESIMQVSQYFDRDPDEVVIALIHLARKSKISGRKGGLFGNH